MTNFSRLRVKLSPKFLRVYKGLDPVIKRQVKSAVVKLSKDPNSKGLRLEPLQAVEGFFKARVNDSYRILIRQEQDELGAYFLVVEVGKHDIYRQW